MINMEKIEGQPENYEKYQSIFKLFDGMTVSEALFVLARLRSQIMTNSVVKVIKE